MSVLQRRVQVIRVFREKLIHEKTRNRVLEEVTTRLLAQQILTEPNWGFEWKMIENVFTRDTGLIGRSRNGQILLRDEKGDERYRER